MALVTRLTRLFRADAHAVLDRLEEPDVLLRQAMREMDEEVARTAQALRTLELDHEQTRTRLAEVESSLADIAGELDLCFAAGNHDLVRTLLRRRLAGERWTKHLGQRMARLAGEIAQRRRVHDDQRRCLEGMRQKAAIFDIDSNADRSGADGCSGTGGAPEFAVSEEDIDLAFLREQQRRKTS